jgi:hypothetical protein
VKDASAYALAATGGGSHQTDKTFGKNQAWTGGVEAAKAANLELEMHTSVGPRQI